VNLCPLPSERLVRCPACQGKAILPVRGVCSHAPCAVCRGRGEVWLTAEGKYTARRPPARPRLARGALLVLLFCLAYLAGCDGPLRVSGRDAGQEALRLTAQDVSAATPDILPAAGSLDGAAVGVDAAPAYPVCGSGPISIAEDCATVGAWRCQVPTELERTPCAVPNLARWLVASCADCTSTPKESP
jgi:hypothetical protein